MDRIGTKTLIFGCVGKAVTGQHKTHLTFNHLSQTWATGQRLRYHSCMADRRWSCLIQGMWHFKAAGLQYWGCDEAILVRFYFLVGWMHFLVLIWKLIFSFTEFGANQTPNVVLDIWHLMFPNSVGSLGRWQLQTELEWLSIPFGCAGALNASSSAAPTIHWTSWFPNSTAEEGLGLVPSLVWFGQDVHAKDIAMRFSRE